MIRRIAQFLLFAAALLAGPSAGFAAEPDLSATPPKSAALLLNGRDLDGWVVYLKDDSVAPASVWSVKDGVLRLDTKVSGYIRTAKKFSNFRYHVEWRWPADANPKSNSGVFVHLRGADAIWPAGIECQLASGNAGQLVGTAVDLPGAPLINAKKRAPKLAASSEKPLGEWNAYDIFCRGDTIEVFVNGVRQNRVEKISVDSGAVGLQMEGYPIEFRNVWLSPL